MSEPDDVRERFSVARMYDYFLGGSHNYEVDRAGAHALLDVVPEAAELAWANRGFHQRAARWMVRRAGIRQFLDIGSGLPTQSNTHHVVQQVERSAKIAYVDNDPAVDEQAQGLLSEIGNTVFVSGDVREPERILTHPEVTGLIDLRQPVGLLMTAILHFVPDEDDPAMLVTRLVTALAPGSYVAISHGTTDLHAEQRVEGVIGVYRNKSTSTIRPRTLQQIQTYFKGLRLVEPYGGAGPRLTYVGQWGAEDPEVADDDAGRWMYCGVGRKAAPGDRDIVERAVLD